VKSKIGLSHLKITALAKTSDQLMLKLRNNYTCNMNINHFMLGKKNLVK